MLNRNMLNGTYNENDFVFFWGHRVTKNQITETCFSQWWMCDFEENGIAFCCAEQYMMYYKALLFKDEKYADLIIRSRVPKDIKAYGRMVRGFDPIIWDKYKREIVVKGNYLKFSQNPELKKFLMETEDKIIVEASPYDKIWGIGMRKGTKNCIDPSKWNGENLLGFAIMEAREMLKSNQDITAMNPIQDIELEDAEDKAENTIEEKIDIPVGCKIHHKVFGTGTVLEVNEKSLIIHFPKAGEKKLGIEWCLKNCCLES